MADCFSPMIGIGPIPVLSELLLLCVCVFADRLNVFPGQSEWTAAVRDNTVHGTIGLLSWAVYSEWRLKTQDVLLCVVCGLLAMALDADHFLMAKTLTLKKALSHPTRPPLHATSLIPILASLIYATSRLCSWKCGGTLSVMLTVAWLSHHIRDGIRRGLWLPPFGSTPPIPFSLYVLCTAILPMLFKMGRWYLQSLSSLSRPEPTKDESLVMLDL